MDDGRKDVTEYRYQLFNRKTIPKGLFIVFCFATMSFILILLYNHFIFQIPGTVFNYNYRFNLHLILLKLFHIR